MIFMLALPELMFIWDYDLRYCHEKQQNMWRLALYVAFMAICANFLHLFYG